MANEIKQQFMFKILEGTHGPEISGSIIAETENIATLAIVRAFHLDKDGGPFSKTIAIMADSKKAPSGADIFLRLKEK